MLVVSESEPDLARVTVSATLRPGQRQRLVKYVAYGWSAVRSQPAVADQVAAALTEAQQSGWDGLVAQQRDYLDEFWAGADVVVDGDPRVQQAVRFALFHLLQAGARAEGRAIPAKGLTGPGYDGPRVLGHRDLRAPRSHLHRPAGRCRRTAVATLDPAPSA